MGTASFKISFEYFGAPNLIARNFLFAEIGFHRLVYPHALDYRITIKIFFICSRSLNAIYDVLDLARIANLQADWDFST